MGVRRCFSLIILFLGVVFLILWGIYSPKMAGSGKEVLFKIEKGQGAKEISLNLQEQGLIKRGPFFRIYVLFRGTSKDLQAGVYKLSPLMNIPKIAEKFSLGDVAKESITIPEGWNLRDIGSLFEQKGMFRAEDLWKITGFPPLKYKKVVETPLPKPSTGAELGAGLVPHRPDSGVGTGAGDFSSDFDFLKDKPKTISLEGYLFPDTYQIAYGTPIEEAVRIMLQNFDTKLNQGLKNEILKPTVPTQQKKTIFEIITMASLIEKEVKTKEDKELISGILWKRLKNKMPLQVDATVSYITGEKTMEVSKEETQIDSPYNTYKYRGLPLGPISNPGIESIEAAIYPKSSQYWYYLSTPDGETIFSKTLEKHNIAKAKYLK